MTDWLGGTFVDDQTNEVNTASVTPASCSTTLLGHRSGRDNRA